MLILASASEARQHLLNQAGIPHRVIVSGVDEKTISHKDPKTLVLNLANAKANAVYKNLILQTKGNNNESDIKYILGCDSIFEFKGEILGKPKDKIQAIERLQNLSNNKGILHTGHALIKYERMSERCNIFSLCLCAD